MNGTLYEETRKIPYETLGEESILLKKQKHSIEKNKIFLQENE